MATEMKPGNGMLWFNSDPKTSFVQKVKRAMDYYLQKYGKQPNTVYVNPATKIEAIEGVIIKTDSYIMPNSFWIKTE